MANRASQATKSPGFLWHIPSGYQSVGKHGGHEHQMTAKSFLGFLVVGRLSDIFGRRWFFIVGNVLALICGILGATATNINTLIGGNILGGLAGAVQISFTVAIAELVPNKYEINICSAGDTYANLSTHHCAGIVRSGLLAFFSHPSNSRALDRLLRKCLSRTPHLAGGSTSKYMAGGFQISMDGG